MLITWLKYINFAYKQKDDHLSKFLDDCLNKEEIYSSLLDKAFHSIIKISYPVHSSKAFLLNEKQFRFLQELKSEVLEEVKNDPYEQFTIVQKIINNKEIPSLSVMVIDNINQLLNENSYAERYLELASINS